MSRRVFRFPGLDAESFRGLPGLLADSLPDRFGNALIDAWLAGRGRPPTASTPSNAGIHMPPTHLLEEAGRRHFMVRRIDRDARGGKVHMQSLAALRHLDFNLPEANSYEQALLTVRELGRRVPLAGSLATPAVEEQLRRMVFNVVARNQDDHVKNIAFLMDREGVWSVNGRRDAFTVEDLRAAAATASLAPGRVDAVLEQVVCAVRGWPERAAQAGVAEERIEQVAATHRLELPPG